MNERIVITMKVSLSVSSDGSLVFTESKSEQKLREKGASILSLPQNYTILDLETTGLNPEYDSIIEIACIKYRDGEEISRFQTLVQPPRLDGDTEYIDSFIEDLTGITNEMLASAPTFPTIADDVWNFLADELIVGHNVNFDINFLYDTFLNLDGRVFRNDFVDTMRLARRVLPDLKHHRLKDLDSHFDIGSKHHRALGDCITTNLVLQHLARLVIENDIDITPNKITDLRSIAGDPSKALTDHPFYNRYCVFTGKLERFTRKDAALLVANIGGHCENGVTKKTNFLIVGDFDYSMGIKDGKSSKMKKAEKLILDGQDLSIITETVFYGMLEDSFLANAD